MPQEIRMPPLGQTTDELLISRWLVAEGDAVETGGILLEVETDKALLEVESFASGILLKILHGDGETVQSGCLLAYIGIPGEALPAADRDEIQVMQEEIRAPGQNAQKPAASPDRILVSPAVRKLAQDYGIDLLHVRGSGPGGRIEKKDILSLIEGGDKASPA